jgi:uncharacterized membrane protein YkvI
MRIQWWQSVKIGMTIVGTTIGAGFASGREIWEFFGSYGNHSGSSILLAMLLFCLASVVILSISWQKGTRHYSEVLAHILGPRVGQWFDQLVLLFLLTSTLVMVAGSGATFEQWSGSFMAGALVMAVAVMMILFFDIRGLMAMNTFIIPVMTSVLIWVCIEFLLGNPSVPLTVSETTSALPVWPSAITYAAFNIISLLAVLSTVGSQIRHPAEIWTAAILSAGCLGLVAYLYNYSLLKVTHLISQYEIPLFALVKSYSKSWVFTISLVLWLAIYTTAASNVHGLVFRLSDHWNIPRWIIGAVILAVLTPLSQLGFQTLVQFLYPLSGVLNLFLLTMILLYPFSRDKK